MSSARATSLPSAASLTLPIGRGPPTAGDAGPPPRPPSSSSSAAATDAIPSSSGYDVAVRVLGAAHLPPGDPLWGPLGSTDSYFVLKATPVDAAEARAAVAAADAVAAALAGGGGGGGEKNKGENKEGERERRRGRRQQQPQRLHHPPLITYESSVVRHSRSPRWGDAIRLGRVGGSAGGARGSGGGSGGGGIALEFFVFDRDLLASRDDLLCAGGFFLVGPPRTTATPPPPSKQELVAVPALGARLSLPEPHPNDGRFVCSSSSSSSSSSGEDDDGRQRHQGPSQPPTSAAAAPAAAAAAPGEIVEDLTTRLRLTLRLALPPRLRTRERRRSPLRGAGGEDPRAEGEEDGGASSSASSSSSSWSGGLSALLLGSGGGGSTTTTAAAAAAAQGDGGDPSVRLSWLPTLEQVKLEERAISLPLPDEHGDHHGHEQRRQQRSSRRHSDGGGGGGGDDDDDEQEAGWRTREAPAALPTSSGGGNNAFTQNNTFIRAAERAASRVRRRAGAMAAAAVAAAAAAPGIARQAVRRAEARHHAPRLFLALEFSPSRGPPGPVTARAPVRYRQHLMPFADALIGGVDGGASAPLALPNNNPQAAAGGGPDPSSSSSASSSRAAWAAAARLGPTFTARARGAGGNGGNLGGGGDDSNNRHQVPFFSAYKLFLSGARAAFAASGLEPCRWCPDNRRAAVVFGSRALSAALRAKHRLIYSPMLDAPVPLLLPRARAAMLAAAVVEDGRAPAAAPGPSFRATTTPTTATPPTSRATTVRQGTLESGDDLLVGLLRGGRRAGEPRYFTYVVTRRGQLFCGETGAGVLADVMSKHALHSGVAHEVLCAGELCVVPRAVLRRLTAEARPPRRGGGGEGVAPWPLAADDGLWDRDDDEGDDEADGGERLVLVLDNNSGTYRPPAAAVALTARVLRQNLPRLRVAVVDATADPRLPLLHARVPSREVVAV